jgi:hypothetical protein
MKRTMTTSVDVPRGGKAPAGRSTLRVELTFSMEEATAVSTPEDPVEPVVEQPAGPPAGKRMSEQEPAELNTDPRPTRHRTSQEASAPPPRLGARQAGEVARRIAATFGAEVVGEASDPEALLTFAARIASGYLSAMQTIAAGGPHPTLVRVRVGEVGGRTFVDLEP